MNKHSMSTEDCEFAYDRGFQAYLDGVERNKNPYEFGGHTDMVCNWDDGWLDSKDQYDAWCNE